MLMNKKIKLLMLPLLFALVSCGNDASTSDTTDTNNTSSSSDTEGTEVPNDPHWVHFETYCSATLESVFTAQIDAMPLVENGTLILEGWFLESGYINIVSFPYRVLEDVTLHAKWTEGNPAEFTFSSTLDGSGYIVTSYGGNATNVVIPSYHNSKPVLELGEYLFNEKDLSELLNLNLSPTVDFVKNDCLISLYSISFRGIYRSKYKVNTEYPYRIHLIENSLLIENNSNNRF